MKLNIGSGENHIEGYRSVDKRQEAHPEIVCEIGKMRLPFENDSVDEILAHNSFEHFDNFIGVVEDLARVSKNGAIWKVTLPYATSYLYNVINPYHVNPWFTEHTFAFWDQIYKREQPSWFKLKILKTEFVYNKELWGDKNRTEKEWEMLRQSSLNVVKEFYQEIKVIK